jgi:hypothetical protein
MGSFSILTSLAVVSALAVLGMLLLVAFPVRRLLGPEWAVVLAIAIITAPLVVYALLPWGEALAAFLTFAFVVVACQRRPAWLFALAVLAGITKETAAPFLLVLGLVCARSAADRFLPPTRLLLPLVGGVLAGFAVNLLFNVFRFGTTANIYYTAFPRVPGLGRRFKYAVSLWFAPNVGVLWFWFLAAVIVAGLVVATVLLVIRHLREPLVWLPPAIVVGLIALFTAGLASWYSPFGWIAWGPRHMLPFLPAFLLAGVWTAREPMTAGLRWTIQRAVPLAAVTVVVVVLGFAQAGIVWNRAPIEFPLVLDAECPALYPIELTTPDYFYGCGLHEAWRLEPLSLWSAAQDGPATQQVAEFLQATVAIVGAVWLALRARDPARARSDSSSEVTDSLVARTPDPVRSAM